MSENAIFLVLAAIAILVQLFFLLQYTIGSYHGLSGQISASVLLVSGLVTAYALLAYRPGNNQQFYSAYLIYTFAIPALSLARLVGGIVFSPQNRATWGKLFEALFSGRLNAGQVGYLFGIFLGTLIGLLIPPTLFLFLFRKFGFGRVQAIGLSVIAVLMMINWIGSDRSQQQIANRPSQPAPTNRAEKWDAPSPPTFDRPPSGFSERTNRPRSGSPQSPTPSRPTTPAISATPEQLAAIEPTQDTQGGEPILDEFDADDEAPARRTADSVWIQLSNLRLEDGIGAKKSLYLDFHREGKSSPAASFVLVAKSGPQKKVIPSVGLFRDESGTVEVSFFGGQPSESITIEIWVEEHRRFGRTQLRMKVSNSITMGSVPELTYARHWRDDEKLAVYQDTATKLPPPTLPDGYEKVTSHTPLLAGMPIKAGMNQAWVSAEVIQVRNDGDVLVKYQNQSELVIRSRDWLAIEPKTLETASSQPDAFQPSVPAVPGGRSVIPPDLLPVDADTPLVVGTPVKCEGTSGLEDATVQKIEEHGYVLVKYSSGMPPGLVPMPRSWIFITQETRDQLNDPEAAQKFANRPPSPRKKSANDWPGWGPGESGQVKEWTDALDKAAFFDRKFNIREYNRAITLVDDQALQTHLKSCPAIKRPVLQVFWGFGIEYGKGAAKNDEGWGHADSEAFQSEFWLKKEIEERLGPFGGSLLDGLAERTKQNQFGMWDSVRQNGRKSERPGVVLVPPGGFEAMVANARKSHIDLLLAAKIDLQPGAGRKSNATLTMRVIDVLRGAELWKSQSISSKKQDLAVMQSLLDECFAYIDGSVVLKPFPNLAPAVAQKRASTLTAHHSPDPISALAELRYYQLKGLLTAEEAKQAYGKFLAPASIELFSSADQNSRAEAIHTLLPSEW